MYEIQVPISVVTALSSTTRLAVLRTLVGRRMTAAEVSAELGVARGTAHTHLRKLERAGLTLARRSGRLWVYYEITPVGRQIASPGGARIFVQLAVSAIGLAAAAGLLAAAAPGGGFAT